MTTFPLDDLYEKLGEVEKLKIQQNQRIREIRFRGSFDKHAKRILRIPRFCRADEEVMWLKQYRPDIALYKCKILEWQLLVKFDIAKEAAWKNLRKLLLPAAGQYRKSTDPTHSEICSHLLHIICIDVISYIHIMNRMRDFVSCFNDEELSKFIHAAGEFKREMTPKYFIGFMLLRPTLMESHSKHIIEQLKGAAHKYRGFERICRLLGKTKFFWYKDDQDIDVLAEHFVREIEDMHALKEKNPLSHDLDNYSSCEENRKNELKMYTETFEFFKAYCIRKNFCGESVTTVRDLACVVPADVMIIPIRRVLTFALLYHRRMVPSIDARKVMGIWMHEFEWDIDLNGNIEVVNDKRFSYHTCFRSLARFITRFEMNNEGFKRAIAQSGGDRIVKLVALALLYTGQYEKAIEIIDTFMEGRSYEEIPPFYFLRLQALIRQKKFDESIGIALNALLHAATKGWTSSTTAPIVVRKNYIEETVMRGRDVYLDDEDKKDIRSPVHLITERDTALYSCHLLVNLIRSRWAKKKAKGATYYQSLIALSQLHFSHSGRDLFDKMIAEIEDEKVLHAPYLLFSIQNRYMISTFSRIFMQFIDDPIIVCEEMKKRKIATEEEKNKYQNDIIEIFQRAHTEATETAETLIPSIAKFIGQLAKGIFKGIEGNEKKEFISPFLEDVEEIETEEDQSASQEEETIEKGEGIKEANEVRLESTEKEEGQIDEKKEEKKEETKESEEKKEEKKEETITVIEEQMETDEGEKKEEKKLDEVPEKVDEPMETESSGEVEKTEEKKEGTEPTVVPSAEVSNKDEAKEKKEDKQKEVEEKSDEKMETDETEGAVEEMVAAVGSEKASEGTGNKGEK